MLKDLSFWYPAVTKPPAPSSNVKQQLVRTAVWGKNCSRTTPINIFVFVKYYNLEKLFFLYDILYYTQKRAGIADIHCLFYLYLWPIDIMASDHGRYHYSLKPISPVNHGRYRFWTVVISPNDDQWWKFNKKSCDSAVKE